MNLTDIEEGLDLRTPLVPFINKKPQRWPNADLRNKCWDWKDHKAHQEVSRTLYTLSTGQMLGRSYRIIHTCGNPACVNPNHHLGVYQKMNQPSVYDRLERHISYIRTGPKVVCWIWTGPVSYMNIPILTYRGHVIKDVKFMVSELHGQVLRPNQGLKNTCNDPMCINPHHQKVHNRRIIPNIT